MKRHQTQSLVLIIVQFLIYVLASSEENGFNDVIVSTQLGDIKGSLMETRLGKKVYAFRGIYYAEPPTGKLRFKPPVPVKPWLGTVLDASKEGPSCIQEKGINMSENCLTLNIYTKQIQKKNDPSTVKKLPVIVFLFPGRFIQGTAQSFMYGPKYLLDHDVILVSVNHRLASLGFLNTGDEYASGNMAFYDQILALRFIRDNIEKFGGDPNSVTLAGQSAGSRSISLHLVSPMSRGLFHKAIGMSGTMLTNVPSQREQIGLAIKQAKLLNCSIDSRDKMFECLRARPAEDYGETIPSFLEWDNNPQLIWYPSIEKDGGFLSLEPDKLMKQGKIYEVPIIYGTTQDEYSGKISEAVEKALKGDHKYFQDLTDRWYELAPICFQYDRDTNRSRYISRELLKFYFNNEPITVNKSDALRRLFADSLAHFPIYRTAKLISKYSSAPVYFYKFSYRGRYSSADPKQSSGRVAHGDDLQYVFNIDNDIYNQPAKFPLFTEEDPEIVMVKQLTAIWAHFATTGQPLPDEPGLFGKLTWEKFTPERRRYLNIGQNLTMETDFFSESMELFDALFPED